MKIWSADYHIFLVLIRTPKPQQSRLTEICLPIGIRRSKVSNYRIQAHHINNLINVEGTCNE